jgi:hypothetical protein
MSAAIHYYDHTPEKRKQLVVWTLRETTFTPEDVRSWSLKTLAAMLDFGDYLGLVLLDTGHTSPIAGEQTDWLEKALKARAEHPNVIVVNHVPAYPSYRRMEGDPGQSGHGRGQPQALGALVPEVPHADRVLESHDHTFKRTKPLLADLADDNGVLYLGDGSRGRLRSPCDPEQLAYLAASSRDYHQSLHRIQGAEQFHVALDEHGLIMDVCRCAQ